MNITGQIILVRHGQANAKATDEASYDQLSELGQQQAVWLGQHMRDLGHSFDHVLSGTLNRQRATAENMGFTPMQDVRLNEMQYFKLAAEFERLTGRASPNSYDSFAAHIPDCTAAWHRGDLDAAHLPFEDFKSRIIEVIEEAAAKKGRTLIVTSGGVIGMALLHYLRLTPPQFAHMMLPIRNTSLHRFDIINDTPRLVGYNTIPHLERSDRLHASTFV